jgi:hypothetical protein
MSDARSLTSDIRVGPVADRVSVWPHDDGTYGVDATFQGSSGHDDAAHYEERLKKVGARYTLKQELDGGWTLRFGPLRHEEALRLVEAFIV